MAVVINTRKNTCTLSGSTNPAQPGASLELVTLFPGINHLTGSKEKMWDFKRLGVKGVAAKEAVEGKGDKAGQPAVAEVEAIPADPEIVAALEAGDFVIGVDMKGKPLSEVPRDLSEMDVTMAIKFVKSATNASLIQTWLFAEKRDKVRKELEEQLKWAKDFDAKMDDAKRKTS